MGIFDKLRQKDLRLKISWIMKQDSKSKILTNTKNKM